MSRQSDPCILPVKSSKGKRDTHRDMHKGGYGGKIQAMFTSRYFIFRKVALLDV